MEMSLGKVDLKKFVKEQIKKESEGEDIKAELEKRFSGIKTRKISVPKPKQTPRKLARKKRFNLPKVKEKVVVKKVVKKPKIVVRLKKPSQVKLPEKRSIYFKEIWEDEKRGLYFK